MRLVVVASSGAAAALRPLLRAHERDREVEVVSSPTSGAELEELAVGSEALLVVGDRRRAPRTALPGLFVEARDGRWVPVGWLPDLGAAELERFARAAARVHRRERIPGPVALLGERQARYLRLAARMDAHLRQAGDPPFQVLRWTADRITRGDVARGLGGGLGCALYFGHGRPEGWAGYHGLRAQHLLEGPREPLGALVSVTCLTANRHRVGLSFCEAVVTGGAAAASVGAVGKVDHVDSMRWMVGLAQALLMGECRLGPALRRAVPPGEGPGGPYRIIGDPLAPLCGTREGARRASRVFAPPPDHEPWIPSSPSFGASSRESPSSIPV